MCVSLSLSLYIYTHVCIYVCIYIYMMCMYVYIYIYVSCYLSLSLFIYIYIYTYTCIHIGSPFRVEPPSNSAAGQLREGPVGPFDRRTASFHNFKSQNFKLSVSTPESKWVACLSVLSQISNCQGLGRKNKS